MVNVGSTVAAAISAVAAWRSLRIAHDAAAAQREQGRPYLSFEEARLEPKQLPNGAPGQPPVVNPNVAVVKGLFKNYGSRPAVQLTASIFILPHGDSTPPIQLPSSLADDFPPGAAWMAQLGEQTLAVAHPGYFMAVGMKYSDLLTSRSYRQLFFMRWPGVQDGQVFADIVAATNDDRTRLIQQHRSVLNPYL